MSELFREVPGSNWNRLTYAATHKIIRGVGSACFGYYTEGQEHVPKEGRVIIACTHLNGSDVVMVPAAIEKRHVTVLGRRDKMQGMLGALFSKWGAITVDRPEDGENPRFNREQMQTIEASLSEEERAVLIFSSGTRTPGQPPTIVRRGVAMFARHTESPIVPAVIKNSDHLVRCLALGLPLKDLGGVGVKFGPPLDPPEKPTDDKKLMSVILAQQQTMFESML